LLSHTQGIVLPTQTFFASQWFVWALGALSVEWYYGVVRLPAWCHNLKVGSLILLGTAALILYDRQYPYSAFRKPIWFFMDPLLGVGFFIVLNYCVSSERAWKGRTLLQRFLRPIAFVGLFSYSLYLTHQMILLHLAPVLSQWVGIKNDTWFLLILSPTCLFFAWIFFRLFEKPFLNAGKPRPVLVPKYTAEA